jgi:MFS family permease
MAGCILPLVIAGRRHVAPSETTERVRVAMRRDLAIAWAARLLMQIASSGAGLYLFFYFETLTDGRSGGAASVARLLFLGTLFPVPIALVLGRWSDRIGRRKPFLASTAMLATLGVAGMALAQSWMIGAIAYVAFASGVAAFVALNTGHAMLLLPEGAKRGRDLGILNLANTIPQIVAPLLAWGAGPANGFVPVLVIMAILALLSGVLPLLVGDEVRSDA